jgi:X-X-X-Leu-X-X-Gly heptad repeat protein
MDNNSFSIKVDITAQNDVSTTLDAISGGLEGMVEELLAVQVAAAGMSLEVSDGFARLASGAKQVSQGMGELSQPTLGVLQSLGHVLGEIPNGIKGVASQLDDLAMAWMAQVAASGSAKLAFSAVTAALSGPAGLAMVGISAVSVLVEMFGDDLVRAVTNGGESVDGLKDSIADISNYTDIDLKVSISGAEGMTKMMLQLQQLDKQLEYMQLRYNKLMAVRNTLPKWYEAIGDTPLPGPNQGKSNVAKVNAHKVAEADLASFDQQMAIDIERKKRSTGSSSKDAEYLVRWRGYAEDQARDIIAIRDKEWERRVLTADPKFHGGGSGSGRGSSTRGSGVHSAAMKPDDYTQVMQALDEERKKLMMTATEYEVYRRIKEAGVAEGSARVASIRAEVTSLAELEQSTKEATKAQEVMLDLDERYRKATMSAPDYELYSYLKKAGVERGSDAGKKIEDHLMQIRSAEQSLRKALDEGFSQWSSSFGSMLNEMVWTSKMSFGDILQSFGQMITQMIIQTMIVKPLNTAFSNWINPTSPGATPGLDADISSMIKSNPGIFANGGIMTADGPMSLRRYANGGVATTTQMAVFGEGSRPEAFVPLPDGRSIPVAMDWAGGSRASSPAVMRIEVVNPPGVPLKAQASQSFDVNGMVTRIVLSDFSSNGPLRQSVAAIAQGGA